MFRHALIPFHSMLAFTLFAGFALPAAAATDTHVSASYGKLPLYFEANRGQTDKDVRFLSRGAGYGLYLTASETVLVLTKPDAKARGKSVALRMSLVGATRKPVVSGLEEQPGKANYFVGQDRSKWRTNVPTYAKVHYKDVYPGIDLVYYGNQRQLEYDFVVAPGADPKNIVLGFKGAEKLEIDSQGDLVLHASGGDIRQHKPLVYQEIDGMRQEIAGSYVRKGANRVGFKLAAFDRSRPLVIDPILSYSTYLGNSNSQPMFSSIAVDKEGNAYVAGVTNSNDFPTTAGAFQPSIGDCCGSGTDVFVTKLNPTGTGLVYSTYLGGINFDQIGGIAVDTDGNAYLTGNTNSPNFPTTPGAFSTSLNAGGSGTSPNGAGPAPNFGTNSSSDAFVTKLNANGSALVYSTYLGGLSSETGDAIAIAKDGSAYVAGGTKSFNFPTTPGAFQRTFAGDFNSSIDAFVTKLDPTGSFLVYSTYLGGTNIDGVGGITADADGNAYVTGTTLSTNFPVTPGAFQPAHGPGTFTAYVTKLNPSGSALVYSTYLGGSGRNEAFGIAIDDQRNAYVTGSTASSDFPTTAGAFQTTFKGPGGIFETPDAFVTKLNSSGSALVYSTYLGGGFGGDLGQGIAVDSAGSAYVTGFTSSTDFPTTLGAFQTTHAGGGNDVFATKLDPTGSALVYSTYLGGTDHDEASAIAIDNGGSAYVTGTTQSTNFPTTPGAFQLIGGGPRVSSFVTKIPGIALLVIDKDGIDDGRAPNFFPPIQVNDDVAALGVRAQLRFFRDQVGQTITLPAGAVGDEGWFALKTIPASWAQAGGVAGFVGNPAANPEDPAPQGTGPGLGAPDANGDPDSLLKNVPNVTPLGATALNNLIGREVCAVVYDNQVSINQDQRTGDLRGANLGTVAFQVVGLAAPSGDASPTSLPNVQVRIRDARTMCRGPFALLTNAEAP